MATYEKGVYQAEVVGQGFAESASKGTPYFYLQLLVLARYAADGTPQECPRYERTYEQYLAGETGVIILRAQLRAIGVEVARFEQLDPSAPGHLSLVGRKIDVACDVETYQGKPRERWTIPTPKKKLNREGVRALQDNFGHVLDGSGQAKPSSAVERPNDSDVPF
jgi:hypothetical protein